MPYDAITIDANIVIHDGFKFDAGLLAQLSQFKDGAIAFVVSEVVQREILKHLSATTKTARDATLKVVDEAVKQGLLKGEAATNLEAAAKAMLDSRDVARERFNAFVAMTGMQILPISMVGLEKLMELYFNVQPPFELSKDKKHEFPDAAALLAIEAWARREGNRVLAVSKDKGWASFAAKSDYIDVEPELAKALTTLQEHTEQAEKSIIAFLDDLCAGKLPNQAKYLKEQLSDSIELLEASGEADSHLHFELDSITPKLVAFEILNYSGAYDFVIVRMGHDLVVIRILMFFKIEAEAQFSFAVWDGIDREYIGMGSTNASGAIEQELNVLITFQGNIFGSDSGLEMVSAEVDDKLDEFYFGDLELDYDPDER